jgi:hypothetical protein
MVKKVTDLMNTLLNAKVQKTAIVFCWILLSVAVSRVVTQLEYVMTGVYILR